MEEVEFKERLVIVPYLGIIALVAFLLIPQIALLAREHFGTLAFCVVLLLCSVLLGAATLILYSFKGLVRADRDGVNIRILLFGKTISEKYYAYGDVQKVSCTVEVHRTKNLKYHEMVFVIRLADEKDLRFAKRLPIRFDLDRKNPSAYFLVTSSEPMERLYDFVMLNKKRISDEKYSR